MLALFLVAPAAAQDPSDKLASFLRDPSYKVRLKAAITIGKLKVSHAAPALRSALADGNDTVRAAAAYSLGQLGDQASRGALVALLSDTKPLIFKASTKALSLLDRAKGGTNQFLVVVAEPALGAGVPKGRAKRLTRTFNRKIQRSPLVTMSAGEQDVISGKRLFAHLQARKLSGITLRPKLVELNASESGGSTNFTCKVSVMVIALTNNRMEFAANGEAEAEVEDAGLDPDTIHDVKSQVLDAAAAAAADEVTSFLARRRGL